MPSPPPPYSPDTPEPAGQGVPVPFSPAPFSPATFSPVPFTPVMENMGFLASPVAESSTRPSPQVPMSPCFPPPPGQSSRNRDRSSSNQRSFFSLSGLRGKQPANTDLQTSYTVHVPEEVEPQPPAARRAASAGHVHYSAAIVAAHTQRTGTAG